MQDSREGGREIRAVLWDIGGVLVRTVDRSVRARLAERLGLSYDQLVEVVFGGELGYQAQLGLRSAADQWRYACEEVGLPETEAHALRREFFGGDVLDDELLAFIRSLRPRYLIGIISNAMEDTRELVNNAWGMQDTFDDIILSAEVGLVKPDPHIYQLALERLGVEPRQAVFIDDFIENVQGARQVGMGAIHFVSAAQARDELGALLDAHHTD